MKIESDYDKAAANPLNHESVTLFDRYADMDFSDAKPVSEIPALAQLQAKQGGKSRITMRVDTDTLAFFKARAEMCGGSYQTLIKQIINLQKPDGETNNITL